MTEFLHINCNENEFWWFEPVLKSNNHRLVIDYVILNIGGWVHASFTWVFVGDAISNKLNADKRRRSVNWFMGSLLLVCLPMILR